LSSPASEISKAEFLRLYSGVVADYPHLQKAPHEVRRFFKTMQLLASECPRNISVVDTGAWPGTLSVCLKRGGWNVAAIDKDSSRAPRAGTDFVAGIEDPSAAAAGVFSSICEREGIRIENVDLERTPLPFPTESVDVVILAEVIEHLWSNPLFALREVNRILKRETGRLLLSTPNLTALRNRFNFLRGQVDRIIEHPFVSFLKVERMGHLGHLRLYAPEELRVMLSLMGFQCRFVFERIHFADSEFLVEARDRGNRGDDNGNFNVQKHNSLTKRLLKDPVAYWNAGWATALEFLEKVHPPFRQQVYVVGVKITDADFQQNHEESLRRLIADNRCPERG